MELRNIIINAFYFFCLLVIVSVTNTSSNISKIDINIDNIRYDIKPMINIEPMDKINRWIDIPTYDGSGQTTHPKVLYFEEGYNGYKYWMVNTPYPYNDAYLENPSIIVSNDGIVWIEPEGIQNPVSGYPNSVRDDSYYSDPFILYDEDHFELFFRKTKSILNGRYDKNGYNYLYTQTSEDGIHYTKPKMILNNNPPERYMSLSVIKENELYKIWYVNYDGKVRYVETVDLINYTEPVTVKIDNFKSNVWHGEVQKLDDKYICIFMIKYKLFYTESIDGINFTKPRLIDTEVESLGEKTNHIYKTTYIIKDDYIELFIPYRIQGRWRIHYTKVSRESFFSQI